MTAMMWKTIRGFKAETSIAGATVRAADPK